MRIAVTGANGTVGRALLSELNPKQFEVTPLDLPDHDVSNREYLIEATRGHDAIVHLAWAVARDNDQSGDIDTVNCRMMTNVYQAAAANGIRRVIMGSSNHAHRHDMPDWDGKIRASINPPIPDSPYGAEKVFMESLGRYYATAEGLEVVCVRIGNVNAANKPNANIPRRWLSHRDLGQLVTAALTTETIPNNFEVMYGVSDQDVFDLSNSFGYVPRDKS